ncbi:DUF2970 domain-containing protein [Shewanella inventionis]|uniref:DUF2970 domain-containing protein n=1 Tax=Shewanella inventionis TaxID=1738770 RepID=A0ABQ1INB2_9GAMM|nr:DUF2970 domain-containing protein [Shewanella inventionis]MCL1156293.1 DUF2970 domain-containing protein [Shewanella inventionis]UAL43323.1 DUF2970 domain-containing protein [Shewanella inventionis]GGB44417.1 DUF2970 domain-containing protein [Shewanella inventionis]
MSFWRVFSSTVAAFFGVQTEHNRQKDFQSQSPLPFIIMGILLAVGLVLTLVLIVNQVLS